MTFVQATYTNFLGKSPHWYKNLIIAFLIINPVIFFWIDPYLAGWMLVVEFIFTLAMALKCYPLQPGGLLAIQAVAIGLTSPYQVLHEITVNLEVLLLLIFMVAGIYFMKNLLMFLFTKIITKVRNKVVISLLFCFVSAFLSAFLDALTVIAVVISVATGFYTIYHKVASKVNNHHDHDHSKDDHLCPVTKKDLEDFRAFLRNLVMHAGIGTALGGVCTMVGEPQNLIIAQSASWDFAEFALRMSPVTIYTFIAGLLTCILVEKLKWFSYGAKLPETVFNILKEYDADSDAKRTKTDKAKLIFQALIGIWLIVGLAMHLAAVGLIGLSVLILATVFNGVTDEHALGHAFEEALPFTALLAVFFTVVAVIIDQQLFAPVIHWALTFEGNNQLAIFYIANGFLSMVSDNVFVGTVYITELKKAFLAGELTRQQFELLSVAVNTGTNLPSVATPNGQAAFLFLLTSGLAPLIRLGYGKMVFMALPYTIVLTVVGLACVYYNLPDATISLYESGWIEPYTGEAVSDNSSSHH